MPHEVIQHKGCSVCAKNSPEASKEKYLKLLAEQQREDIDPTEYSCHQNRNIRCNKCGNIQKQKPHNVISGNGCTPCALKERGEAATARREAGLDLTGQVFGELTVISYSHTDLARMWRCSCRCGREALVSTSALLRGNTKSCGCLRSGPEKELLAYVQSLGFLDAAPSRSVLPGRYELDVYVPSAKTAFEYCGLHWHGEIVNGKEARLKHLKKLESCHQQGVALVTIFADEWLTRNEIVKDRISAILGVPRMSIGARKCKVIDVDRDTARAFEKEHHLQGECKATKSIGLVFCDQVVAVASFSRSSDVRKGPASDEVWELVRYTIRKGVRVQGGLGRLLQSFRKWCPACKKVISFADRRWSTGKLYAACGFTLDRTLPPDYRYFKTSTEHPRFHKFGFRIRVLAKKYGIPVTTEWQMARDAGFDRIWDCGLERWVLQV
jgi:hypothetical protein